MRLLSLDMTNIGPFDEAHIQFLESAEDERPVTFITGENGTGKTIVLDAIRAMFSAPYASLERTITRPRSRATASAELYFDGKPLSLQLSPMGPNFSGFPLTDLQLIAVGVRSDSGDIPNWVLDFWRPSRATGGFDINNLIKPNHRKFLEDSLQGEHRNAELTELVTFFDYLRGSDVETEATAGRALYDLSAKIIESALLDDGKLVRIDRSSFMPIVRQAGHEVPLANVSSGNAYLIQRMISLLGKMYSVHVLRGTPPDTIAQTPGLLLIDEAENHLHPRWQNRFIQGMLDVFPNLQIIATTHSPFILASWPNARVYVCRYDKERGACTIDDETADYAHKPIDEIVASPAFDGTYPFGPEITKLLRERKEAAEAGDQGLRKTIERKLLELNPAYFGYLTLDEKLAQLGRGAA